MALNEGTGSGRAGSADRDPALERAYASAERAEPPRHLDAAILAAAHREAGARPRPLAALRTWRLPMALAAVIVLSVSLVTLMREEGGNELYQAVRPGFPRPAAPAAPAPQPSEDAARADARNTGPARQRAPRTEAPASRSTETRDLDASEIQRRAQGMGSSQALEPAPRPEPKPFQSAPERVGERPGGPPAAADDAAREAAPPRAMHSERDMSRREDAAGAASGGVAAPAPRAVEVPRALGKLSAQKRESAPPMQPQVAAMVKELDAQPPEKWLERIQVLRREGQSAEARELLAEFKRRYPAHPLPPELQ